MRIAGLATTIGIPATPIEIAVMRISVPVSQHPLNGVPKRAVPSRYRSELSREGASATPPDAVAPGLA